MIFMLVMLPMILLGAICMGIQASFLGGWHAMDKWIRNW